MNPVNFQRDGFWIKSLEIANDILWSNVAETSGYQLNSDGIVNNAVGAARANEGQISVAANLRSIGVMMAPPIDDNTPYRVKAAIPINRNKTKNNNA